MNDMFGINTGIISHPFRAFECAILVDFIGLCPMIGYHTLSGLSTIVFTIRFIQKSLSSAPQNNINSELALSLQSGT
jgi:hypothetical protein